MWSEKRNAGTLQRPDQLLHVVTSEYDEIGRLDGLVVRAQVERYRVHGDAAAPQPAHRRDDEVEAATDRPHTFDRIARPSEVEIAELDPSRRPDIRRDGLATMTNHHCAKLFRIVIEAQAPPPRLEHAANCKRLQNVHTRPLLVGKRGRFAKLAAPRRVRRLGHLALGA